MKVIINIPKDRFEEIKSGNFDTGGYFKRNLSECFREGIPLSKGHGKIVDANEVLKNGDNWEVETALMQIEAIIPADDEK